MMAIFMKANSNQTYMMEKELLQHLKESILEDLEMGFKMVMGSSGGKTDLFIVALIIMDRDKAMGNFTTLKTQVLVADFGKREF